ncbi:hypothetical protein BHE74_00029345 [Ensete ventricosum]|nr:hypothetical protein BHE74_00029345 [Ensete ventricosum]
MNPLTLVKRTQKINSTEAALGISDEASWHAKYKESAYIFIGGIPFDLTEGDLLAVFSQYGEVVDVNLVRDKSTGKSKGFAFLAYEDQRSTILAVEGDSKSGLANKDSHSSRLKTYEDDDEYRKSRRDKHSDRRNLEANPEDRLDMQGNGKRQRLDEESSSSRYRSWEDRACAEVSGVEADRRDGETTEDEPTSLSLREKERREAATATGAAPISSPRVAIIVEMVGFRLNVMNSAQREFGSVSGKKEEGEGQAPGDERLDPREGSRGKLTESERDPPVAPGEEKEGNPSSSHSRPRLLTPPAPPYPFPGFCLLLFPVTSTESPQPLTVRRGGESRGRTTAGAGS